MAHGLRYFMSIINNRIAIKFLSNVKGERDCDYQQVCSMNEQLPCTLPLLKAKYLIKIVIDYRFLYWIIIAAIIEGSIYKTTFLIELTEKQRIQIPRMRANITNLDSMCSKLKNYNPVQSNRFESLAIKFFSTQIRNN